MKLGGDVRKSALTKDSRCVTPPAVGSPTELAFSWRPAGFSRIIVGFPENEHETHLPTLESATRPHPRLSGPHEAPGWPRRHQRPPRQGPQAPGRLRPQRPPVVRPLAVQRLKTRAQFQAVLAAGIVARTAHFALHRMPMETDR